MENSQEGPIDGQFHSRMKGSLSWLMVAVMFACKPLLGIHQLYCFAHICVRNTGACEIMFNLNGNIY